MRSAGRSDLEMRLRRALLVPLTSSETDLLTGDPVHELHHELPHGTHAADRRGQQRRTSARDPYPALTWPRPAKRPHLPQIGRQLPSLCDEDEAHACPFVHARTASSRGVLGFLFGFAG